MQASSLQGTCQSSLLRLLHSLHSHMLAHCVRCIEQEREDERVGALPPCALLLRRHVALLFSHVRHYWHLPITSLQPIIPTVCMISCTTRWLVLYCPTWRILCSCCQVALCSRMWQPCSPCFDSSSSSQKHHTSTVDCLHRPTHQQPCLSIGGMAC
ncbi:uncharacterized protein LOC120356494 [Nilaparvata lugens]|uniref:uncharacterized protein LOC120356494 n=1 Tax=Nilaparvata lugens TaxID=108931 RepID=UPI00193C9BB9|nr:uncharacterized protein LOC120356494 [Nilaparvata lugens]